MMRALVPLLLLTTLVSGCLSGDGGEETSDDDGAGFRDGVVIHNEEYTASGVQPATFQVQVEPGAREVILEIQQDSGVLPNLHVELTGCGEADPPASAGDWQAYPLCDAPQAGLQTLTISVRSGGPTGTGRALLRADLPS